MSKPYPELSIINIVKSISLATGRISDELAEEVFGDSTGGDHLAYSGAPTTRSCALRATPFKLAEPKVNKLAQRRRGGLQLAANKRLAREIQGPALRQRLITILSEDSEQWDVDACEFGDVLHGVVRDRGYEKVWSSRPDGQLVVGESINCHVFACACSNGADEGSGIDIASTVEPTTGPPADQWTSSLPSPPSSQSTSVSYTSSQSSELPEAPSPSTAPSTLPRFSSQRTPFESTEHIAYGLVKRWIVVRQKGEPDQGAAIIAHVRIFLSSLEPHTGCPIIRQRSPAGYEDHYMLAKHIVCRITLSSHPQDSSCFLVSHVI